MLNRLIFSSFFIFLCGCNFISNDDSQNIARYDDSLLTNKEYINLMGNYDKDDSLSKANNIINNWAIDKILIERAQLNLNDSKLQSIELLVKDYEASLLSEAYLEALINSSINPDIDSTEIKEFYDKNKSLFRLNEDIFRLAFIELPLDFSDTYQVRVKLKRYRDADRQFLDSISYRYNSFSFESENWISKKQLIQKFPFITNYSYKSLKNYNFFQYKDSLSLYLIKIIKSTKNGDISPIEYVLPTLEYMSLNKRKKELMLSIKSEILKDALLNNKFEIY
ncbi:MAG: hypothetical protein ACJ0O0_01010 [Flavobacteriaceae bacterium]|jgi:hypothetical protein|tara:strand:- start:1017 stop:1856 length:840 start_codon:yes stop_codon:yes gene_type:complete